MDTNTFPATDLEGFKRLAAELLKALPRLSWEQAESGFKCLSIAYLEHYGNASELDRAQSVSVWEFTGRKVVAHQIELELKAKRLQR